MKEKNSKLLKIVKILNSTALVLDFLLIIAYATILIVVFNSVKIPESTADMANPESVLQQYFKIGNYTYSVATVNSTITLMLIFLIFGVSLFVVNFKHNKKLDIYDYHRWEAGNIYIKSILSLTTVNVISFIIRIVAADLLIRYSEDKSTFAFLKFYFKERKERKLKDKERDKLDNETAEVTEIRKKVRKQLILKVTRYTITYLFLILIAMFILIPFYWMILTSLKSYQQSNQVTNPEIFLSFKDLQWLNMKFVIQNLNFGLYIRNTLIVAVVSTTGTILTTIFASFAFARIDFKGRDTLFSILLMTMMIPGEIYMITNFLTVSQAGFKWIGSTSSTALGYFATMILPFIITVPLISPSIFYIVITSVIGAFKSYSSVIAIFGKTGAPAGASYSLKTIVFYIYDYFENPDKMPVAAAASIVLFAIILLLTIIQMQIGKRKVHY